jgi:hypothetical protein
MKQKHNVNWQGKARQGKAKHNVNWQGKAKQSRKQLTSFEIGKPTQVIGNWCRK